MRRSPAWQACWRRTWRALLPACVLLFSAACAASDSAPDALADSSADLAARSSYPALALELDALLSRQDSRLEPGLPQPAAARVSDLHASQSAIGHLKLDFSYANRGDYNQDGQVRASDLSLIGAFLGATEQDAVWVSAQIADGNDDGLISAQDLAQIGAAFNARVDGYLVESRPSGGDEQQWQQLADLPLEKGFMTPGGGALHFSAEAAAGGQLELRVRPYFLATSGLKDAGISSNVVALFVDPGPPPLGAPSGLKVSAGLYGDRVQLSWDPVPGALRHLVYRDGGAPILSLGPVGAAVDFSVADYLAHEYYIRAERGAEIGPASLSATGYLGERRGWPMPGRNAQHRGQGEQPGPAAGGSGWRFDSTDLLERCAPAVASDGTVYVGGAGGLYAVRSSGFLKWSSDFGGALDGSVQLKASPAIGLDGSIIVGLNNGELYALSPDDGSVRWQVALSHPVLSAATIGPLGRIYLQNERYLYAFDQQGRKLWRTQIASKAALWRCSPALGQDGSIYANGLGLDADSNEGYTHAVNPDGSIRWSFASGALGAAGSGPAVGPDGRVYTFGFDRFEAINIDGTLAWDYDTGFAPNTPAIAADGTIYVNGSELFALSPEGGLRWHSYNISAPNNPSPVLDSQGNVYLTGGSLYLATALDPQGQIIWQRPAEGTAQAPAAFGLDGELYVCSSTGELQSIGGS